MAVGAEVVRDPPTAVVGAKVVRDVPTATGGPTRTTFPLIPSKATTSWAILYETKNIFLPCPAYPPPTCIAKKSFLDQAYDRASQLVRAVTSAQGTIGAMELVVAAKSYSKVHGVNFPNNPPLVCGVPEFLEQVELPLIDTFFHAAPCDDEAMAGTKAADKVVTPTPCA